MRSVENIPQGAEWRLRGKDWRDDMKWLTAQRAASGRVLRGPEVPAVAVRIYKASEQCRVCLMLNAAFVKAARLQPGDRLKIGIDGEIVGLMRSEDGNAISGGGFSLKRENKPRSKKDKSTPYVAFNEASFADVAAWAKPRLRQWIVMIDKGTHWESAE
jgi:hypothetical protein